MLLWETFSLSEGLSQEHPAFYLLFHGRKPKIGPRLAEIQSINPEDIVLAMLLNGSYSILIPPSFLFKQSITCPERIIHNNFVNGFLTPCVATKTY